MHNKGREQKKDDYDVATNVNYHVACFSSWYESTCNPEMDITKIKGPRRLLPPFEVAHTSWLLSLPQGQALRFPRGWLKLGS